MPLHHNLIPRILAQFSVAAHWRALDTQAAYDKPNRRGRTSFGESKPVPLAEVANICRKNTAAADAKEEADKKAGLVPADTIWSRYNTAIDFEFKAYEDIASWIQLMNAVRLLTAYHMGIEPTLKFMSLHENATRRMIEKKQESYAADGFLPADFKTEELESWQENSEQLWSGQDENPQSLIRYHHWENALQGNHLLIGVPSRFSLAFNETSFRLNTFSDKKEWIINHSAVIHEATKNTAGMQAMTGHLLELKAMLEKGTTVQSPVGEPWRFIVLRANETAQAESLRRQLDHDLGLTARHTVLFPQGQNNYIFAVNMDEFTRALSQPRPHSAVLREISRAVAISDLAHTEEAGKKTADVLLNNDFTQEYGPMKKLALAKQDGEREREEKSSRPALLEP